ncbi:styrene monooxygenase NADH-dependent flavin reductase subunit StyB [Zavarzinia compransoris]|uniref:Flavin reductase n=1 Tax=Zavarzinia compransoris TaxID=1264899 RepID=A0A317DXU4_9PROT|nr:flavin reductase family protein [Zavarzinia compransoris]PWR18666.1 flavin reductase [Zavarzinia compransoris]TDP40088.1 styrene monooxygenase reductase component [Zavarzinia compransoris]
MSTADVLHEGLPGVEPVHFRKTVAHFATGVAIVSCIDEGDPQPHGMTISSFTSISLDPPTILVSIKPGRMHRLISKEGWFGVSVLGEAQQGHSRYFAGDRGPAVPVFATRNRIPTLRDCLAWFECEVTSRIQVHDHTLFVARVMHCDALGGPPLLFFSSRYSAVQAL